MKCEICNKEYNTFRGLSSHAVQKHKISKEEYYNKFIKNDLNDGICKTCGKQTKFLNLNLGYRQFCSVSCSRLNENTQEKFKNTCLKKYNSENPYAFGTENYKLKIKEKYGVNNISQSQIIKDKKEQSFLNHFGIKNNFGNRKIMEKAIQSSQLDDAWKKRRNSLKINGNQSKLEDYFESKLLELGYKLNETYKVQYSCEKYPYHCDFYLVDTNTFIEINGHWTHGGHLFNKDNLDDINTLNIWKEKSKTSIFYKTGIKVWTEYDLEKYNIAKNNNLNYIILWTKEDIDNYFN